MVRYDQRDSISVILSPELSLPTNITSIFHVRSRLLPQLISIQLYNFPKMLRSLKMYPSSVHSISKLISDGINYCPGLISGVGRVGFRVRVCRTCLKPDTALQELRLNKWGMCNNPTETLLSC